MFESFMHTILLFYDWYNILLEFCEILCFNWKQILKARSSFFYNVQIQCYYQGSQSESLAVSRKESLHTKTAALYSEAWTKITVRHTGSIFHYRRASLQSTIRVEPSSLQQVIMYLGLSLVFSPWSASNKCEGCGLAAVYAFTDKRFYVQFSKNALRESPISCLSLRRNWSCAAFKEGELGPLGANTFQVWKEMTPGHFGDLEPWLAVPFWGLTLQTEMFLFAADLSIIQANVCVASASPSHFY